MFLNQFRENRFMNNKFTVKFERDSGWYIAYCPEVPGANGQGKTQKQCYRNLIQAIQLILEDRRLDSIMK